MKLIVLFVATFASILFCHAQHNITQLDALLCELGRKDQHVRINLNNAVQNGKIDSIVIYAQEMELIDQTNQNHVKKILQRGVPDNLSTDAYKALFLIVDHADVKYQEQHFKHIKRLSANGHIANHDVATLKDRILIQRSQTTLWYTDKSKTHSYHNRRRDTPHHQLCVAGKESAKVGYTPQQSRTWHHTTAGHSS
ncbi:MAG: hypothetical protein IIY05_04085 [Alistipes sp.]|nr:hypothetical protein [Alistipes sp.]